MNQDQATDRRALPSADTRPDHATAIIVEAGIVMQDLRGTRDAAVYLSDNQVDMQTAVRVLTRPAWRRSNTAP